MTIKLTNSQEIVAKVFSDLDLQETNQKVLDMINWIGEAIERIGTTTHLQFKVTGQDGLDHIELKDFHARLPRDLFKMESVLYAKELSDNTDWRPMRKSTNMFGAEHDKNSIGHTYFLKPGWLNANVREGYLKMAYYVFPVDCNGYPLVPDSALYHEAVYWYIVMKLLYPKWVKGQMRPEAYLEAKRNWGLYKNKAHAQLMYPTIDEMESLKNQSLTLMPDVNAHSNQMSHLSQQEQYYNQGGRYITREYRGFYL